MAGEMTYGEAVSTLLRHGIEWKSMTQREVRSVARRLRALQAVADLARELRESQALSMRAYSKDASDRVYAIYPKLDTALAALDEEVGG